MIYNCVAVRKPDMTSDLFVLHGKDPRQQPQRVIPVTVSHTYYEVVVTQLAVRFDVGL